MRWLENLKKPGAWRGTVTAQLDRIEAALATLRGEVTRMSAALDTLTAEVSATGGTIDSAIVLINGLADKIDALIAAGNNDPALAALADDLRTKKDALAQAVADNPVPA